MPELAALNGRPCRLFLNSAALSTVATPGHSMSGADSKSDQLNIPSPPAATPGERDSFFAHTACLIACCSALLCAAQLQAHAAPAVLTLQKAPMQSHVLPELLCLLYGSAPAGSAGEVSAESVESMQSSAAPTIPLAAPAPEAAWAAKVARPDQALSATGASAPSSPVAPAVAASAPSAAARGQPPAAAAAGVPQPAGTIKVTRPDLAEARSALNMAPVLGSTGSLFGLADSPPTLVSYQRGSPPPPQAAGSNLLSRPDQAAAPSAGAAAVSTPGAMAAADTSSSDASPSSAADVAALSIPHAPEASVVRSPGKLAGDTVSKPG